MNHTRKAAIFAALLGCTTGYGATIFTTPTGLGPGTQYQLVFVTSDAVLGNLATISAYNTFVTNEAALNPTLAAFDLANGVTWTVVGSTGAVDADVNSPSTGLVYTLNNVEVAAIGVYGLSANPLGSDLLNPININQNGDTEVTTVWTGSGQNFGNGSSGTAFGGSGGGFNALGGVFPEFGNSGDTGAVCCSSWEESGNGIESNNALAVYAISSVITVPRTSSTPEPATVILTGAALVLIAIKRLSR